MFVAQQNEYFANYQAALQKKDDQIERLEKLVDSLVKNNIDTANESNNIPKKFKKSLFKKYLTDFLIA